MPKINVPQKNISLVVAPNANLMRALMTAGVPVASSCLGDGICGKCRMQIHGNVKPADEFELGTLQRNKAELGERLSCQVSVTEDLTVETSYW